MNLDESIAHDMLSAIGYTNIQHEPDGNNPPDFLVDNRIAVEVRRLNENFFNSSKPEGLEQLHLAIDRFFTKEINRGERNNENANWVIEVFYQRPLHLNRSKKRDVKNWLSDFKWGRTKERKKTFESNDGHLSVQLIPVQSSSRKFFIPGVFVDYDSGGWVSEVLKENLEFCINEKEEKIYRVKDRYETWFLILIDYIGFLYAPPIDEIKESLDEFLSKYDLSASEFSQIILVDPGNHGNYYSLSSCT